MTNSKFKNYFFFVFVTLFFYHVSTAQTSVNPLFQDLLENEDEKIKVLIPYINRFSSSKSDSTALILSIIKTESNFQTSAESQAGALGLMQLMPTTAHQEYRNQGIKWPKEQLKGNLIQQPELNLAIGIKHLERLQRQYSGITNSDLRIRLVLAAYNAGHTKVRRAFRCRNTSCVVSRINEKGSKYFQRNIKRLPSETRSYITIVKKQMLHYSQLYQADLPKAA